MQRSSEERDTAAEIARLAHAWMAAARDHDAAALERLLVPEYRLVSLTPVSGYHAVVERGLDRRRENPPHVQTQEDAQ